MPFISPISIVDEFRSLHTDDILSMSMVMNILATASYDGDIILWTIETGMPFMRLNSSQDIKPKLISLSWLYKQTTKGAIQAVFPKYFSRQRIRQLHKRHADNTERIRQSLLTRLRTNYETSVESFLKSNIPSQSHRSSISSDYHLDQLIFLHTRDISPLSATLITGGSAGWVWWWSIHVIGSLIAVFNAARKPQEHVLAMCVDEKCQILFTSDTAGYVALWFIGDYACKQPDSKEKQLRLMEEKSRILTKFSASLHPTTTEIHEMKNQSEQKLRDHLGTPRIAVDQDRATYLLNTVVYPHLLIAYRAHLRPITCICYANDRELVITSSIDCTIRLFTLTGRYVGFMSQSTPWGPLSSTISLKDLPKRVPEDIRRKGSATTLEVLRGDIGKRWKLLKHTIVAWTSLPIFQYFYQNKNHDVQEAASINDESSKMPHESQGVIDSPAQKIDTVVTKEWMRRRDRLRRLIGLDRVDATPNRKDLSVESMLKIQRDNFGITAPVLGRFARRYMQHRPRSDVDRVKIYGGKAIIYSLLPLATLPETIPAFELNLREVQKVIIAGSLNEKPRRSQSAENSARHRMNANSSTRPSEVFTQQVELPKVPQKQKLALCASTNFPRRSP